MTLRSGSPPLAASIAVNAGPTVSLAALGSAGSTISLAGGDGADRFDLRHIANWQMGNVVVSNTAIGGGSQVRLTAASVNDDFVYTPSSASDAQVLLTSGGSTTTPRVPGVRKSWLCCSSP